MFENTNIWFLLAGLTASLVTLVHIFLGGREIARPLLLSQDIRPVPKFTNYYAWHMVTLLLAMMAGAFVYCGALQTGRELALTQTALATAFTLLSLALAIWKKQKLWAMPQWLFFLPIAAFGLMGLS